METERKYKKADLAEVARKLSALGFVSGGRHFESNTVFDELDLTLFGKDCLLRLRIQEWPDKTRCKLTWKGPTDQKLLLSENVKSREEIELEIGDAAAMAAILERLGCQPVATYEKIRESWRGPAGITVELDYLPFGEFVEIEGDAQAIEEVANSLALDKSEISLKTYYEINQEWRAKKGLPKAAGFEFDPAIRASLRADLGLS